MSKRFPGRRLSPVRLTILLAIVAVLATAGVLGMRTWEDTQQAERSQPWFGAYVDVTATPVYAFENPTGPADRNVVLGFVVATDPTTCEASWGAFHSLEEARDDLDLDRRIARLRQSGGEVVVSFGGQASTELALACPTVDDLAAQYGAVVERYRPAAIDLDVEGPALADAASRTRRAEAVARVQEEHDGPLPVWLTLPVGADGLTPDGVATVRAFLDAGVVVAGVNAMTMNLTGAAAADDPAGTAVEALRATHRQLMAILADRGEPVMDRTAWRMVGATPMIGQNDIPTEVVTLDDARRLHAFATEVQLGRVSMWSANRDRTCAPAYDDLSVVSDSCSGVEQGDERFADVLGGGFTGAPDGGSPQPTSTPTVHPEDLTDDPATSPYPVWTVEASYPADTRVVWRRNVYVAAWWTQGAQPDDPSLAPADNPWRLIGPVLPGETPRPQLRLPADFYPTWEPATVYQAGERVLLDDVAYEARWWTQGDSPAAGQADPSASPWRVLTQEEIAALLGG